MTLTIGARDWEVVTGYGHSPEHSALFCAETSVLISGDMVLPRISTNVSVFDIEPEGNPLALYLESLGRYETMPADTLVLPSHGKPFRGVQTRIGQLREHHDARLAEVREACAREAAQRRRYRADHVQAQARYSSDDIRARRSARASASAVARWRTLKRQTGRRMA